MIPLLKQPIFGFEQLTFSQARKLAKPTKVDDSMVKISLRTIDYEADLETLANTLNHINASVVQYCASTPSFKKFLHIFTGRYLKMRSLRRSLPSLINVVNREAMILFNITHTELLTNNRKLAAQIPSRYPSSTPFLQTYHKIKIYHNPTPIKPGGPTNPPGGTAVPPKPIDPSVFTRATGSRGKIDADADVKMSAEQTRKWEILISVQNLFLIDHPEDGGWDHTAKMVNEYILGKMNDLGNNGDVTLPRFFHATQKASWQLIVNSQINQTAAPMGFGAYISTNDESNARYGPNTFALAENAVYPHQAYYYNGTSCGGSQDSLWVRVQSNITVSPKTVAHFVSERASDMEQDGVDFLTKFPAFREKGIVVLTRDASKMLNLYFRQVTKGYDLPRTWQVMNGYSHGTVQSSLTYPINANRGK